MRSVRRKEAWVDSAVTREPERVDVSGHRYDVAILGGGLAGLTLALQLKRARPATSIVVSEKRPRRAPEAAFKVGESTVEMGAHYFREVVGVADHLEQGQLRKHGLRFFAPADDNSDITRRVEYCGPTIPKLWTHQIDRGTFENELSDRCRAAGVELVQGAFVEEIRLGDGDADHAVTIVQGGPGGDRSTFRARWLVDTAGRAKLLKSKLGLERSSDHPINSAWFRLAGGIDLEDWTNDEEWIERVPERGIRRLATNHLLGRGYWMWLIQLSSGPISVGVCADPRIHPFEEINELDRMLDWLRRHEPQLASVVDARRDDVLDFLVIKNYSHSCERVYSPDRWCLSGEAGVFIDPLYSPGSDFIALSNTFITDLVVRDLNGERIVRTSPWTRMKTRAFFWASGKAAKPSTKPPKKPPFDVSKAMANVARSSRLEFYNFLFLNLFQATMGLYRDQYGLFGNAQVMLVKNMFGTITYWSTLANMFLHGKMTDTDFLASVVLHLDRAGRLGARMELFYREWHARDQRQWQGVSVLSRHFQHMLDRQADLVREFDDDALREKIAENVDALYAMAVVIFHKAAEGLPEKPGDDVPINALAISLQPERWEKDGLFAKPGISLAAARERLPGIEEFFLDEAGATVSSEAGGGAPAESAASADHRPSG
jgi:2-polyprenyl-6-methoxyphenol hydroxylase-like FAD-dependent oxidoreductase